jgi:hypothetical protein
MMSLTAELSKHEARLCYVQVVLIEFPLESFVFRGRSVQMCHEPVLCPPRVNRVSDKNVASPKKWQFPEYRDSSACCCAVLLHVRCEGLLAHRAHLCLFCMRVNLLASRMHCECACVHACWLALFSLCVRLLQNKGIPKPGAAVCGEAFVSAWKDVSWLVQSLLWNGCETAELIEE